MAEVVVLEGVSKFLCVAAVLPKWVDVFKRREATALLFSPQSGLAKLATEILLWVMGV